MLAVLAAGCAHEPAASGGDAGSVSASARGPLDIGDSFTIESRVLGETRRINVFMPTVYGQKPDGAVPVLYMPDGGVAEDFLHVAGLMQVLVSNGGMRAFLLVGIENTSRRRDMTGPTTDPEDMKIAPVVGGSAAFRRFVREELMPTVRARYATTGETAIMGESLAGLFVVETFFLEPDLFGSYIAIDPSVWWAQEELVRKAGERLKAGAPEGKAVFLASSNEPQLAELTAKLAGIFEAHRTSGVRVRYEPMPGESHATIYHPAAMAALRAMFPVATESE